MTTVVATRDAMVADTFFTDGSRSEKLIRGTRMIVGYAGDAYAGILLSMWAIDGMRGAPPVMKRSSATVLVLRHDGLFQMDPRGVLLPMTAEFFAIGSGSDYAIGAMEMGATPEEAIEVAARHDPATKLPTYRLDLKRSRK